MNEIPIDQTVEDVYDGTSRKLWRSTRLIQIFELSTELLA